MSDISKLQEDYYQWAKSKSTAGYQVGWHASSVFDFLKETNALNPNAELLDALKKLLNAPENSFSKDIAIREAQELIAKLSK